MATETKTMTPELPSLNEAEAAILRNMQNPEIPTGLDFKTAYKTLVRLKERGLYDIIPESDWEPGGLEINDAGRLALAEWEEKQKK